MHGVGRGLVCACVSVIAVVGCSSSNSRATRASPSVSQSLTQPRALRALSSVVTGFIEPCVAMQSGPLTYAAGTVVASRGVVRFRPIRPGEEKVVFPADVVARQHANTNGRYRFELAPGRYVIAATYDEGGNVHPFLGVIVPSGATLQRNVPDFCM
jgi:hypothetical protein